MSYRVLEVAQHIINFSIKEGEPLTNLKLQKILYYTQAAFLNKFNEVCFEEDIEHWRHGPVIPKVYSKYKSYIDENITDIQNYDTEMCIDSNLNLSVIEINYNVDKFKEEDRELIEKVVRSYFNTSPWEMVDKTHEETPWVKSNTNEIIDTNSIKSYFDMNPERIFG